jgi:hypothetical protein
LPANILAEGLEDFGRQFLGRKLTLGGWEAFAILLSHPAFELDCHILGVRQECGLTPTTHNCPTAFQNVNRRGCHIHLIIVLEDPYTFSLTPRDAGIRRSEVDPVFDRVAHS